MASETAADRTIIAYEIYHQQDMPILPAPVGRQWMDQTPVRFAYRCLPLTIANQAGWIICNPSSFSVRWNGGPQITDTTLIFDQTPPDRRISSLFGSGVVTFNMPYLFRTPAGINLWVKGPSNWPRDGVQALEGIVETDWTSASFTMNWKITRPNHIIRFERGEPICMVVPFPRGLLDQMQPQCVPLADDPPTHDEYQRWSASRNEFHRQIAERDPEAIRVGWQKDYFQGRDPGTDKFEAHQTRLTLRPFPPVEPKE